MKGEQNLIFFCQFTKEMFSFFVDFHYTMLQFLYLKFLLFVVLYFEPCRSKEKVRMTFTDQFDFYSNWTPIKLVKCISLRIFGITTHFGRTKKKD